VVRHHPLCLANVTFYWSSWPSCINDGPAEWSRPKHHGHQFPHACTLSWHLSAALVLWDQAAGGLLGWRCRRGDLELLALGRCFLAVIRHPASHSRTSSCPGTQKLTKLERVLVECLTEGMTVREICRRVKMIRAKLAELQSQVAQKIMEVMGSDVLQDIMQVPTWRIGLDCERELMFCRSTRRS
jgi:hypothetical protein